MKISLWQQFSSNHSAHFTVVGQFETAEMAQQVAQEIRTILIKIAEWHEMLRKKFLEETGREDWHSFKRYLDDIILHANPGETNLERLTPIEHELRKQYDLKTWSHRIEYALDSARVADVVRIDNRSVIVAEDFIDYYTWTGPMPFAELMTALGGQVAVESELDGTLISITLTCTAPSDDVVNKVLEAKQTKFDGKEYVIFDVLGMGYIRGSIHNNGLQIRLVDGVLWTGASWGESFLNLLRYLETLGCSNIEYTLKTSP